MIKNFILRKLITFIVIVFGIIFTVNYLDISPESKAGKKILPNDIAIPVK